MQTRWYRAASAALAAACGIVLWPLYALASVVGITPFIALASVLVGGIALTALALVFCDQSLWERIVTCISAFVARLQTTTLVDDRRIGRRLTAVGLVCYLLLSGWQLSITREPTDDDQIAFLQTAAEVHQTGGPAGLIRDLYAGRFAEANRHPLYIGLLSLHPTWNFGRGLSLMIGFTTLVLLTWLLSRARGERIAGLFCLLLGTNGAFCLFSTRVVCEVLMVLWAGLAYLLIARPPLTLRRSVVIGIVLGLAWLTKGTGLLLIAGYLLLVIIDALRLRFKSVDKPKIIANPQALASIAMVIVVMGLVASPLITRNLRRFGSPFYNVNSQLLFVDEYKDPVALAQQRSVAQAATEYLHAHTIGDIAGREINGLVWELFILLRILGPAPLEDARILFGLPLLMCALIAVIADPRREQGLLVVWTLICVPLFAWYIPVAAGDRFPLPLLAPLLMLAVEGIVRLVQLRSKEK